MTTNRDLKQIIRARMEKTGESYVTARRHVQAARPASGSTAVKIASQAANAMLAGHSTGCVGWSDHQTVFIPPILWCGHEGGRTTTGGRIACR